MLFDGVPLPADEREARKVRQRMGMVFQNFELFPHKTALDNVAIGPITVLGMSEDEARERAMKLLEKVGLRDKAHNFPAASPAASSSASRSPARSRWSPR